MTVAKEIAATPQTRGSNSDVRALLVHVEGSPEAAPRLQAAIDLARKFGATLIGAGAEIFQPLSDPYGLLGGEWVVQLQMLVEDDLKRAEATFRTGAVGIQAEWIGIETVPLGAMARLSRCADLIVAGGAPLRNKDAYRTVDPAELVMLSGRPVLVAPPQAASFRGDAVVVAWKETRESRRAVADSLPFLKLANDVVVVEVCDKDETHDALAHTLDVVEYLRRHGVTARGKAIAARPEAVSLELNNLARTLDADLIVAGAYGHTRFGEWAFGGVTYDLLHAPEGFVLLSH